MSASILHAIVDRLKPDLEAARSRLPFADLAVAARRSPRRMSFAAVFRRPGRHIIAELKAASPSRGVIRADFHPDRLAAGLEANGAAALSVLTEPHYFHGSPEYLRLTAATVKLPLLRKDFIFDPYQIAEARRDGASAVLLIAALLPDGRLRELAAVAAGFGLDVLGEAHDEAEISRLAAIDSIALIGVNARNLRDFSIDRDQMSRLLAAVPADRIAVAESAIRDRADLERLAESGARGFLIGETLMRAADPGLRLRELLS